MADIQDKMERPLSLKDRALRIAARAGLAAGLALPGVKFASASPDLQNGINSRVPGQMDPGNPNYDALENMKMAGATMSPEQQIDKPSTNIFPTYTLESSEATSTPTATPTKEADGTYFGLPETVPGSQLDTLINGNITYHINGAQPGQELILKDIHNVKDMINLASKSGGTINLVRLPIKDQAYSYLIGFPQTTPLDVLRQTTTASGVSTDIVPASFPPNTLFIPNPIDGSLSIIQPVGDTIPGVFIADQNIQSALGNRLDISMGSLAGGTFDKNGNLANVVTKIDSEDVSQLGLKPETLVYGGALVKPVEANSNLSSVDNQILETYPGDENAVKEAGTAQGITDIAWDGESHSYKGTLNGNEVHFFPEAGFPDENGLNKEANDLKDGWFYSGIGITSSDFVPNQSGLKVIPYVSTNARFQDKPYIVNWRPDVTSKQASIDFDVNLLLETFPEYRGSQINAIVVAHQANSTLEIGPAPVIFKDSTQTIVIIQIEQYLPGVVNGDALGYYTFMRMLTPLIRAHHTSLGDSTAIGMDAQGILQNIANSAYSNGQSGWFMVAVPVANNGR